ncbi:MAG: HGGxSTG domain-containing protein [Sphingomicrobium sp.]
MRAEENEFQPNNLKQPSQMAVAPRCLARTRSGKPCQSPAMPNGRCRMHGGPSPGAPKGNRNAWKHGARSAEHRAMRAALRQMRAELAAL